MFRKMPFILLALMVILGGVHSWIPLQIQSVFYALSLTIQSAIVFFLPLIIFGLLLKASIGFAKSASKTILTIFAAIVVSNFLSTMISFVAGKVVYQFDLTMPFPEEWAGLQPAFIFLLPKWIGNEKAMGLALLLGIFLGRFKPVWALKFSFWSDKVNEWMLKGLLYVIPLFLSGFFMKMYHDRVIWAMIQNYGLVFAMIICFVFGYIALIYFVASRSGGLSFIQSLKNMLPATIAGFGSMSSAAAMPLTILGAEKNSKTPELARSIIPATVNVHLMGDCFAIPIFAFAVIKSFGIGDPSLLNYLFFAGFFVLAKFSVAAVPGGGILVMLPILETYLGFNPNMLSLITALYILFDPVITCANVLGNGGFAIHLSRFLAKTKKERIQADPF